MKLIHFIYKLLLLFIFFGLININKDQIIASSEKKSNPVFIYQTFDDWYKACEQKLPFFKDFISEKEEKKKSVIETIKEIIKRKDFPKSTLSRNEFETAINLATKVFKEGELRNENLWLSNAPKPTDPFFTSFFNLEPIMPFVEKLVLKPGVKIAFHGDLHGDIHSLLEFLKKLQTQGYLSKENGFKVNDTSSFYLFFLGDFTDRGIYGIEVWYTLLRLKIENPNNVIMVRGNHEDILIAEKYGFLKECEKKKGAEGRTFGKKIFNKTSRIWDFLPVALYLGCPDGQDFNYLLCCHGGIELGYNPHNLLETQGLHLYQWLGKLDQKKALPIKENLLGTKVQERLKESFKPENFFHIGFMWSDFQVEPSLPSVYTLGRGFMFSKILTEEFIKASSINNHKIRGIFRAHQHAGFYTPMMKSLLHIDRTDLANAGISKLWTDKEDTGQSLWHGIVCTFLVCPDTPYGLSNPHSNYWGFDFDAFGLLSLESKFDDWKLEIYRNPILPKKK